MQIQMEFPIYDEHKLAYAAGYFDGEGTINVLSCGRGSQLRVELTSYDLDSLLVFEELFGGKPRSDGWDGVKFQLFRWAKNNREAISVLSAMAPFLRAKKTQAELALGSGWEFQGRGGLRLTDSQRERDPHSSALSERQRNSIRERSHRRRRT